MNCDDALASILRELGPCVLARYPRDLSRGEHLMFAVYAPVGRGSGSTSTGVPSGLVRSSVASLTRSLSQVQNPPRVGIRALSAIDTLSLAFQQFRSGSVLRHWLSSIVNLLTRATRQAAESDLSSKQRTTNNGTGYRIGCLSSSIQQVASSRFNSDGGRYDTMSKSSNERESVGFAPRVTIHECREMRTRRADGETNSEIADALNRDKTTVTVHVNGNCPHFHSECSRECPFCGERVGKLPNHLPCPEAP